MVSGLFAIPRNASPCAPAAGNNGDFPPRRQFVAGPENALVSRALAAVYEPRETANPLVFTGASGTGKSLLLDLLVDEFRRHFARAAVLSTTAVDLGRAYAHAVETDSLAEFRQRHSRLQMLAIDDVQRLAGKTAAQQELLQLIDSLVRRGSLVAATLRTHPLQSEELSSPLASRLSGGLVIPLALPDHAVRRALLSHYAADLEVPLPSVAAERLAPAGPAPPRLATAPQLRRAVMRLGEHARQNGGQIDEALIHAFLQSGESAPPPLKSIVATTAKHFSVTAANLRGDSRQHSLTAVRGLTMLLARELTGQSYAQIGKFFGNRDHTTVMHACKKAAQAVADDARMRQTLEDLKLQLFAEEGSE